MTVPVFRGGAILMLAGLALGLRLPGLGRRPMHTDEAVHTIKFQQLWQHGQYVYDPHDYHGPTLYYLTVPAMWLGGVRDFARTTEATYRVVPAVIGVALVLLTWGLADGLGKLAAGVAAALTAISPAMVFFSRYYIMEAPLVFFGLAAIVAGWRYARSGRPGWVIVLGLCLGLMHATKETCVLAWIAMGAGLAAVALWARPGRWVRASARFPSATVVGLALAAGAAASVLLMTNFMRNPQAAADSVTTYAQYFTRAGGAGRHDHPWHEYLRMLAWWRLGDGPIWSEGLILLLALVGAVAAVTGRGLGRTSVGLGRFLAVYTVVLTAVYSAIPYKTPWCALGFLHGMILLAGVGATAAFRLLPCAASRAGLAGALLIAGGHLAWQGWRGSFRYEADVRNPYVYAHTSPDLLRLIEQVDRVVAASEDGPATPVLVIAPGDDYWPLPWYFRRLSNAAYLSAPPEQCDAPVIIAAPACEAELRRRIRFMYALADQYDLRPAVPLSLYVRGKLWQRVEQLRR